jgi:phospholipid/cholesterol/gamma-HCH transport system permease protein
MGLILNLIYNFGGIIFFVFLFLREVFKPPYRFSQILREIEFAGIKSIPLIAITAIFLGMVFTLHSIRALSLARMEALVGPTVMLSFARELASGFAGLIVTGRVGSAYCSKIGTMKVTEQIDALSVMGVSPIHFVVVPKILALAISMPLIYFFFLALGLLGGFISASAFGIPPSLFVKDIPSWVEISDLILGVIKSSVFGMVIGLSACYFGFSTKGSAEEVGEKTTESIVYATILLFVSNYIISTLYYAFKD